jgi:uncharacterized protein (DUF736 family)
MTYDNRDRGALFKNDRKNHDDDQAPDYRGALDVGGQAYWINAWLKTSSKTGKKFMSLSVRPKERPRLQRMDDRDEIPF